MSKTETMVSDDSVVSESPRRRWLWVALASGVCLTVAALSLLFWLGYFPFGAEAGSEDVEAATVVNETFQVAPFVVNLAGNESSRFLRISLTFGVYNPTPEEPLKDVDIVLPRVKDRLLSILGSKSSEELLRSEGRDPLKSEMLDAVNEVLPRGRGKALEVYFTEFIIQ